ncbi:hypothetical protein MD484_g5731, partial [Candolleomyces efflorescens]
MPPSPAYNTLCVVYSLSQIIGHAAKHRAAQVGVSATVHKTGSGPGSLGSTTPSATTSSELNASETEAKSNSVRLRQARAAKLREEREAEDEEFRRILNTRWEDRNPGGRPPAELGGLNFQFDLGGDDTGAFGTVKGNFRADDSNPEAVELQGQVHFKVQLKPPLLEEEQPLESHSVTQEDPEPLSERIPVPAEEPTRAPPPKNPPPQVPSPSTSAAPQQDYTYTPSNTTPIPAAATLPLNSTNDVDSSPAQRPVRNLQSSKVPSSRIGRLFHYGGLAASLSYGAAAELARRATGSDEGSSSLMLTEANIKRLVGKLSQMRGAALKLGQFMSIQDTHVLPPELDQIFRRVQDSAHYMPDWQMEEVLSSSFGPNWCNPEKPDETVFTSFDRVPFAAASIGQVHRAVLAPRHLPPDVGDPEHGLEVAVKVQFPNIANSIRSDLGYVKMLLTAGRLLPKGLFLDRTIEVMSSELTDECSYTREASFLQKFASPSYLGDDPRFKIPWVWQGSSDTVLVMERVGGVGVGDISSGIVEEAAGASPLSTQDRNDIATRIIELCLKELFEFRTMQTDPNWTNFLWNARTRQIELVDFGATRTYTKEFMDNWLRLLEAASSNDRQKCIDWSIKLGYLTGDETETMLDAHVRSMTLLATPFQPSTPQPFAFGQNTQWSEITKEIRDLIPVMLSHRLTPPPRETYSLNRKLSGAFLLASRLGAEVDTRAIWEKVVGGYRFGPVEGEISEDVD